MQTWRVAEGQGIGGEAEVVGVTGRETPLDSELVGWMSDFLNVE